MRIVVAEQVVSPLQKMEMEMKMKRNATDQLLPSQYPVRLDVGAIQIWLQWLQSGWRRVLKWQGQGHVEQDPRAAHNAYI